MKKKKFLFAGFICLAMLSACSNEDALTGDNETASLQGNAQMQIQLAVANNTSQVGKRGNVPTDAGDAGEYNVTDVTVVLADANDIAKQVYKKVAVKVAANGTDNTKKVASQVFNVEAGEYKVYVLANYDDAYMNPIIANATDMKNTVFTVTDYAGTACPLAATNAFLMTNTEAPATFTITANGNGTEKNSDGSVTEGGNQKVNIVNATLERSVAKVTFKDQQTEAYTVKDANEKKIASATVVGVDLINLNSQMYLNKRAITYESLGITNTGHDDLYYAEDPNYNTDWNTSWINSGNPFHHVKAADNDFKTPAGAKFYCLENTMEATKQKNGLTTGVLYKVKYEPEADSYTKLVNDANVTGYSAKFKAVIEANEGSGDKDETITADMFDVPENSDGTFYVYSELMFATPNGARMYKAIASNPTAETADIITAYKTDTELTGITTYAAGICYYTAWIRHNTHTDAGYLEAGKYGVVRNHWYNINVGSIKKLGYEKPTYTDPTNPDDKSDVFLQVLVTINPWKYISQNVDLE